jgi:hypothetical protein
LKTEGPLYGWRYRKERSCICESGQQCITEFRSQQSTWQCFHLWSCHQSKKLITIVQNSSVCSGGRYGCINFPRSDYIILEVPAHFAPVKPIHSAQGLTFPTGLVICSISWHMFRNGWLPLEYVAVVRMLYNSHVVSEVVPSHCFV